MPSNGTEKNMEGFENQNPEQNLKEEKNKNYFFFPSWNVGKKKKEEEIIGPEEKRQLKILKLFVANMSALVVLFIGTVVYSNVILRTLERKFNLSSFQTGILNTSNDIIHIMLVIFVSYFGKNRHKPRIVAFTLLFCVVSSYLMVAPHFLFSDNYYSKKPEFLTSNLTSSPRDSKKLQQMCPESKTSNFSQVPPDFFKHLFAAFMRNSTYQNPNSQYSKFIKKAFSVHPAFYFFVFAQFISGVANSSLFSLTMAYIDENTPKNKTSIYLGVLMGIMSFGPMFGMAVAGFSLKFPENLLSNQGPTDLNDQTFIGCWWLGYIFMATLMLILIIPLTFFPKKIRNENKNEDQIFKKLKNNDFEIKVKEEDKDFKQQIKEFPRALIKLLTNKVFVLNLCQIVCGGYTVYSMYVNMVRYIETYFLYPAAIGSVITGVVSSLLGSLGSFIGGWIVSRFKLDTKGAMRLIVVNGVLFLIGLVVIYNLHCPQVQMDMQYNPYNSYYSTVNNECNSNCKCSNEFAPVCGSNGVAYYSACMAGCSKQNNESFSQCRCLRKHENKLYDFKSTFKNKKINFIEKEEEMTARAGFCEPKCKKFIVFSIVLFFMSLAASMTKVPSTMITFSIVDDEERAFALGINSFAINLFGFVPAPLIFGKLIDKSCILWKKTKTGLGACLLYDSTRLRRSIYGGTIIVESIEFIFDFLIFVLIVKKPLNSFASSNESQNLEIKNMEKNDGVINNIKNDDKKNNDNDNNEDENNNNNNNIKNKNNKFNDVSLI